MEDQYIMLITTLLSALLGGVIALVGVFLTNRGNNARLTMQFQNDASKRKEDLLRVRGEELYELIDKWLNALFIYYLTIPLVIENTISYNDALDLQIKRGEKETGNFARIEMLIDVYFPEVRQAYDDLITGRDEVNTIVLEHKRAYQAGSVDRKRFSEPFRQRQAEVSQAAKKLKAEVLEHIRTI